MPRVSFFEKKCNYFRHTGYRRGALFSAGDYWNVLPALLSCVIAVLRGPKDLWIWVLHQTLLLSHLLCLPGPAADVLRKGSAKLLHQPLPCSPACASCTIIFPHLYKHNLPREPEELPWSAGKGFDKSPVKSISWAHA